MTGQHLKSLGKSALSSISSQLGSKSVEMGVGAGVGAIGSMGIHAASGIAGAIGSPTGLTHSDMSFGGMLGAGVRGGIIGAAVAGGASMAGNQAVRHGAHKAFGALGMLAPKTAGRASNAIVNANAGASTFRGSNIAASLDFGRMSVGSLAGNAPISFAGRSKMAMNHLRSGSRGSQATAAGMIGGMGYAAYSANAMGLGIPGNYGYR